MRMYRFRDILGKFYAILAKKLILSSISTQKEGSEKRMQFLLRKLPGLLDYLTSRQRNSRFSEGPSKKAKNNLVQNRQVRNFKNYNKFRSLEMGRPKTCEIVEMAG